MKPVVFSQQDNTQNGSSWSREGFGIQYEKSNVLREGSISKYYYKLSFSYQFKYTNDTVYFAHCFPYTFSDLQKFTTSLLNDPQRKCFISKRLLCYSIAKNKCDIFTITSSSYFDNENEQKDKENISSFQDVLSPLKRPHQLKDKKKIVFLTARQHPGETPASYMIQGVMEFLTDPYNEQAAFLREHFIFKIIPMLNPDGVIHGNYRCSLSGVDLNRQWSNPSRELHPTIYFAKNAIIKYCTERKCRFLCDFHGHSKKMNSFFYGNPYEEDPYLPKIIPMESQNINKGVDFRSCTFKLTADKESTFRQALLNEIPDNPFIYTFEASFYGTQIQYFKNHFSIDDFKNLGRDVIKGFYRSVKQEVEEEIRIYSLQELKSKSNLNLKECNDQANQIADTSKSYKQMLQAQIDIQGGQNEGDNNGSDSNPSEDELSKQELKSLNKQSSKKIIKKLSGSSNLSKGDNLIRQNSSQQNKRLIKTCQEDKISLAGLTTVETSSTKVSSSKKIVLLYSDQGVQTESSFDFSKLQKFSNQKEFFQNIHNKKCYTFEDQQNYGQYQSQQEHEINGEDQQMSQFKNKFINQALQQRKVSTNHIQDQEINDQRPKTSNLTGGRQNYGGRNVSLSFHSKELSNSEKKSSNLLNSNSSLNETQIFQKRVQSFHSTSVGFYQNSQQKNPLNVNHGMKIISYNNTQIPQNQLFLNIQTAMQNRPLGNRLFISGVKYSRDNSKYKNLNSDSVYKASNNSNLKNRKHQEVQTQISIPIILNIHQSSQQQQWQQQMIQQLQPYSQSNILNDIQNQQTNYHKTKQNQLQQQQQQQQQQQEQGSLNQICMQTYNKNHLNGFSPKKKQYILCIQKKDPRSKSPQLRQPVEKRILNSPIQQNNLFKNMNQKLGREIIHSPVIKMYKNISNQNSNLNSSTNYQQNNSNMYDSLNQSLYGSVLDRNKSFSNNQSNNAVYQYINQSSTVQKDHRSNSLNTTSYSSKAKQHSSQKANILSQNSILFTEQASVDYINNLQMNLQIRQCSPYKSPQKQHRSNSRKDYKYTITEPNQQI